MGLESLFIFTLLGGAAAGTYAFETCFTRKREGCRTWLCVLVATVLFAIGVIAAATHVQSMQHAFAALFGGTVNFGSGMVREVGLSGLFLVLLLIDLIITLVKKDSPYALRVITAIVGVIVMVLMGTAYADVYGNMVWSNAAATVLSFVAGDLTMGLAIAAALGSASYEEKPVVYTMVAVCVLLAIGFGLEISAFSAVGANVATQVAGLVVAAVAPAICVLANSKFTNKQALAWLVCVLTVVGVGVARYAFYATCAL